MTSRISRLPWATGSSRSFMNDPSEERPWRSYESLAGLTASWRERLAGRELFRVTAGPGWIGLSLADEEKTFLYLLNRPGALLLWDALELPSQSVRTALGWTKRPHLAAHLSGCRLLTCGILPEDRIVALAFRPAAVPPAAPEDIPGEGDLVLLHQLFGPRGNMVLLDSQQKLMWALHRPPHPLLTRLPPPATYRYAGSEPGNEDATAARFRTAGPAYLAAALETEWLGRLARVVRQAEKSGQRLVDNLGRDLAAAKRGDEHRLAAETLAAHLHELPRGTEEIALASPHDGRELHIRLNPALSPAANMDHFFRLARKADRGQAVIASRLATAQVQLAVLADRRRELDTIASQPSERLEKLLAWRHRHGRELGLDVDAPGRSRRRVAAGINLDLPYRRYLIEQEWEVWVGRNNRDNDELTHRHAAPDDIWFHAQSVPGSHVVLRTGGRPEQVPKRILHKAAALAALNSKARHSGLVPVVFTRRKYVRKPRKSAPGTAAYIREKSLMVAPNLAAGVVAF